MPTLRSLQATRPAASISADVPGQPEPDVQPPCPSAAGSSSESPAPPWPTSSVTAPGERLAGPIGHRHTERHARAHAAVEVVREEVRRERRQNLRRAGVLVDVADAASRRAPGLSAADCDDAGEDHDRQRLPIGRSARARTKRDAVVGRGRGRQREADGRCRVPTAASRAVASVSAIDELVTRVGQRRREPVAHSRGRCAIRIVLVDMAGHDVACQSVTSRHS